jgi:Cohesin domain
MEAKTKSNMKRLNFLTKIPKIHFIFFFVFLAVFYSLPLVSSASTLSISPAAGSFSVGSTFNVSLLLDTKGKSINALQAFISFPADKLQVVSPSVGQSIIGVWTVSPKFNNNTGTLDLRGGIPGGIVASSGVLTNITFRVKSVGEAIIKYTDGSRVFLDDGFGTKTMKQFLVLPMSLQGWRAIVMLSAMIR